MILTETEQNQNSTDNTQPLKLDDISWEAEEQELRTSIKISPSQQHNKPTINISRFPFDLEPQIITKSPRTHADDLQHWSMQYLVDELTVTLLDTKGVFCMMNGNLGKRKADPRNLGRGIRGRLYEEQARYKMGRIPVFRPPPAFVIYLKHLDDRLKQELASLDSEVKDFVMKEAIGRIFEQIDSRYYLLSVKPHLRWRLEN